MARRFYETSAPPRLRQLALGCARVRDALKNLLVHETGRLCQGAAGDPLTSRGGAVRGPAANFLG